MRGRAVLGVAFAALTIGACRGEARVSTRTADDSDSAALISTTLPERAPMTLQGTYVHPPSGFAFPEEAAGFTRVAPCQYDAEGNDVGIGYRRVFDAPTVRFRAEVTIYVFPSVRNADGTQQPFDDQFEGEVRAIHSGHADVREVQRIDAEATSDSKPVHVRVAEFRFRGEPQIGGVPMLTVLAAFLRGPWHVTYRVTFPPQERAHCLAATDELLGALRLPHMGLPAPPLDAR